MRRFAIIVVALLLTTTSFAQLNITAQSKGLRQELKMYNLRAYLYRNLNDGSLSIQMPTNNRYDDAVWFRLGDDDAEAVATCRELLDVMKSMEKGESFSAKQDDTHFYFYRERLMGADYFDVKADGRAGIAQMCAKALEKIIKHLEK